MKFSQDWFSPNIPNFEHIRANLSGIQNILEVGSFEGRSTCWMLQNMLSDTGTIWCVDTFKGGEEHSELNLKGLRDTFEDNVNSCRKPAQNIHVVEKPSYIALAMLVHAEQQFDFIYIDGNHMADEVLVDACLCFKLLKPNGIMLFDDYEGGMGVKDAVQMFYNTHHKKLQVVVFNYQVGFRRLTDSPNAS